MIYISHDNQLLMEWKTNFCESKSVNAKLEAFLSSLAQQNVIAKESFGERKFLCWYYKHKLAELS